MTEFPNPLISTFLGGHARRIGSSVDVATEKEYFGESQSYYEGYLRIEVEGKATTGDSYFLGYNDVSWSTPQNGPTKGVVTGSASTGFIDYSNRYYFTEYEVSFLVFNPYLVMSEIIGFDDVALITEPAPVGPAPVPEPASAIMLMMAGLAGMTGLRRIKKHVK